MLAEVDQVAGEYGYGPVSPLLSDPSSPTTKSLASEQPDLTDLAIFATNAATNEILLGLGVKADVLAGHSFGELAALTSAGAMDVDSATRLVCERAATLRRTGPTETGMAAVSADARRVEHLVGFVDDPSIKVAVDNGPGQTVISGPRSALESLGEVARAAGAVVTPLHTAYAFHNPIMRNSSEEFTAATASLPISAPRQAVFSATLGRYLVSADDVRMLVDNHMVTPVRFYDGLLRLFRDGVRTFVEAGARKALTGIVRNSLPPLVTAVPVLPKRGATNDLERRLFPDEADGEGPEAPTFHNPPESTSVPAETPTRPEPLKAERAQPDTAASTPEPTPRADDAAPGVRTPPPESRETPDESEPAPESDSLLSRTRKIYAENLGFPEEMLTEDIDLEADLGTDSIKQVEIFGIAREHFGLPEPSTGLSPADASTLGEITSLLKSLGSRDTNEG
ncbi:Malonyl CoA-acyl carrier protein transacylase [Actinopolyspora alba]|uniref:[acyl-carrier-protein] S-malonyltransferase n=1 Tax=Actinopolyspora alba TaxID=673379 RepID=A0A1I1TL41_9ACTN|nr:Malonyl CoA-acyl carrier protein transacylase [Actinopolyspora alba]